MHATGIGLRRLVGVVRSAMPKGLASSKVSANRPLSVIPAPSAGAELQLFRARHQSLPISDGDSQDMGELVRCRSALARSMLLFVDPTSESINDLISEPRYGFPASTRSVESLAINSSNHGSLLLNDAVVRGAVGCLDRPGPAD